jgi:hypothetical protein
MEGLSPIACRSRHPVRRAFRCRVVCRLAVLPLALLVVLPGFSATAATFAWKDFDALVTEAEEIFVGTVTAVPGRRLPNGGIVTDVGFDDVRVLKGPLTDRMVLQVLGGTIDDETMELAGAPQFRQGVRYLVFARGNGRWMLPVVGGDHGLFRVIVDPALGVEVVRDARGRPLLDVPIPLAAFVQAVEEALAGRGDRRGR